MLLSRRAVGFLLHTIVQFEARGLQHAAFYRPDLAPVHAQPALVRGHAGCVRLRRRTNAEVAKVECSQAAGSGLIGLRVLRAHVDLPSSLSEASRKIFP